MFRTIQSIPVKLLWVMILALASAADWVIKLNKTNAQEYADFYRHFSSADLSLNRKHQSQSTT